MTQRLPDWIEAQVRALEFFDGVPKALVCDNLKAAVARPLWLEPSLNKTFSALATHYDTTILPTRPRKPRDKGKVEGAVLIVERWILARLRNQQFFSIQALKGAIAELVTASMARSCVGSASPRRDLYEQIERPALRALPNQPFEYAEWKRAKVHPDYHIEVLHGFYSVPPRLIGRQVDVRLTHRMIEIFYNHERVAVHNRRGQRGGHSTVREHMPKSHQRHGGMTLETLVSRDARIGYHVAALIERLIRERPHPEHRAPRGDTQALSVAREWAMVGAKTCARKFFCGPLQELYGRRRLVRAMMETFSVAHALCGTRPSGA